VLLLFIGWYCKSLPFFAVIAMLLPFFSDIGGLLSLFDFWPLDVCSKQLWWLVATEGWSILLGS